MIRPPSLGRVMRATERDAQKLRSAGWLLSREGRSSAALVGPRPRGRPAAFRHVREQRHLTCALDRDRDLPLMPATRTSHPTVSDLASVGQVPP